MGAGESERSHDALSDRAMAVPLCSRSTFPAFVSNLGAILPTSVTVSVWVPVWPLSTDTFTAATPTPPKSLTGCAARS